MYCIPELKLNAACRRIGLNEWGEKEYNLEGVCVKSLHFEHQNDPIGSSLKKINNLVFPPKNRESL